MSNLFNKFTEKLHGDNDNDEPKMSRQQRQKPKDQSMQSEAWGAGNQSGLGYNNNDDNFNNETFGTSTTGQGFDSRNMSQQQGGYTRNTMSQRMGRDDDDDNNNVGSGLNVEEDDEEMEADRNLSFGRNMSGSKTRERRNQGDRSQGYQEMSNDQPW